MSVNNPLLKLGFKKLGTWSSGIVLNEVKTEGLKIALAFTEIKVLGARK